MKKQIIPQPKTEIKEIYPRPIQEIELSIAKEMIKEKSKQIDILQWKYEWVCQALEIVMDSR